MISRHWCGIARPEAADRYVVHLREETFPKLSFIEGFLDAKILRRVVAQGVEFRIVTTWISLEAVRKFAGDNPTAAVVPEQVQAMMVSYDRTVDHYDVIE